MGTQSTDYKAIDAVVNIWTEEALSQRPDWGPDFFSGKMNAERGLMAGVSLEGAKISKFDPDS